MAGFRDSINNLIRSDRPESPTELVFIIGSLAVVALVVYAAQIRVTVAGYTIPHFSELLAFLVACKGVKVWRGKGAAAPVPPAQEVPSASAAQ